MESCATMGCFNANTQCNKDTGMCDAKACKADEDCTGFPPLCNT